MVAIFCDTFTVKSTYAWYSQPDAPQQNSDEYVFNANSSHWLTSLDTPLTGFSILYGPEGTERSARPVTRWHTYYARVDAVLSCQ